MAEFGIILYKSKKLSSGEHPLMLRISHAGVRLYKSLGFSCAATLWDSAKGLVKRGHPHRDEINERIASELGAIRSRVAGFKIKGKPYTAQMVLDGELSHKTYLLSFMTEIVDTLKLNNRPGNAKARIRRYYETLLGFHLKFFPSFSITCVKVALYC